MSELINTVRVKCQQVEGNMLGYYVVNESDVTPDMVLFDITHDEQKTAIGVADARKALDEAGIKYPDGAKKAEIMALYKEHF
jgi:hypothetical protein